MIATEMRPWLKKSIDKSRTLPDVMYYSVYPMQPANVAQSVEQLTRNEQVAGSIPAVGSEENPELF